METKNKDINSKTANKSGEVTVSSKTRAILKDRQAIGHEDYGAHPVTNFSISSGFSKKRSIESNVSFNLED